MPADTHRFVTLTGSPVEVREGAPSVSSDGGEGVRGGGDEGDGVGGRAGARAGGARGAEDGEGGGGGVLEGKGKAVGSGDHHVVDRPAGEFSEMMVEPTDGDGEIDLVGVASAGAEVRSPLVGELQNDAKYKRDSNRKSAHNQDGIMKS